MKLLIAFFILAMQICAVSLDSIKTAILQEGILLYKMEKASWHATDHFQAHFKYKEAKLGGYVSYQKDNNTYVTVFFNKENPSQIELRYYFTGLPTKNPDEIDTSVSSATPLEKQLIDLRGKALQCVIEDTEEFFKHYKFGSINLIPLINENGKRVFILTGSNKSDMVIIGNDYLLTFDNLYSLEKKEKIHNSIIQMPVNVKEGPVESSIHSHFLNDFITSSDICTFLLYKNYFGYSRHLVMSKNYMSIFDTETETLEILTMEAYQKIMAGTKK